MKIGAGGFLAGVFVKLLFLWEKAYRNMSVSEIVQIVLSAVGVLIALVLGVWQIRLARQMKLFELRQDSRDKRHNDAVMFAEVTRFIQKYSNGGHKSDIYLLPLCVAAYAYNPSYPYRREMYREFCGLTEDVQNAILQRCELSIVSKKRFDFYSTVIKHIIEVVDTYYPGDQNIFYDNGKYFESALLYYGEKTVPELRCPVDMDEANFRKSGFSTYRDDKSDMDYVAHITNLLAWHKTERPIYTLFYGLTNKCAPNSADEIVTSYLCCIVAKYVVIYNLNAPDNFESGCVCDFIGDRYMEDLFLEALYEIMICIEM